jgi:hypothetical protein
MKIFVALLSATLVSAKSENKIQVIYKGEFGDWKSMKSCNSNMAICGLNARIDPKGADDDNVGVNGLKIKCCSIHENLWDQDQRQMDIAYGEDGKWSGWKMCNKDSFVMGWDIKYNVEKYEKNNDHIGVGGIKVLCDNFDGSNLNTQIAESDQDGRWIYEHNHDEIESLANKVLFCGAAI